MRKILFIHPRVGYMDTQRDNPAPPLGILSAVALLYESFEIIIHDQRLYIADREFYSQLQAYLDMQPLYVAFSVYTGPTITYALEISTFIKRNSSIPIVWGGIHPSLAPEQTLANSNIDYVIQGEGEQTLLEFSQVLARDTVMLSPIKGVWLKKNGLPVYGGERPFLDLALLPPIPYHLIDINKYIQRYAGNEYIYYQVSRGCPRRCGYCYNAPFNKGQFRVQSIDKIVQEIITLRKQYSFKAVYFVDDNIFALGRSAMLLLGKKMSENNLLWSVQGSDVVALNEFTADDFKLLEKYGLTRISIGIESASAKIRAQIKKPGTTTQIVQIMRALQNTKILIWTSYIVNFPGETIADLYESVQFVFELQRINKSIRSSPFYMYTPFPGTPMYLEIHEVFRPKTLEEWGKLGYERTKLVVFAEYLKDPHFFQSLFLVSLLNDDKAADFSTNPVVVLLARLYRPLARWRLKHLFFHWNLELFLFKKIFPKILV